MVIRWASKYAIGDCHIFPDWEEQKDFGVWNITYQTVPCLPDWEGSNDAAALGSVTNLGPESVCCPANPTVSIEKQVVCFMLNVMKQGNTNDTCPSYSDQNGIPYVFVSCVL
jgi:hypothetical protein